MVTFLILASLAASLATPTVLPKFRLAIERSLSAGGLPLSLGTNRVGLNLFHSRNSTDEGKSVPRFAFFNSWDDNGFYSLRLNVNKFDVLLPEWLQINATSNELMSSRARQEAESRLWIQKNAHHLQIMPVVNNYNPASDGWDSKGIESILSDAGRRQTYVSAIAERLAAKRDAGVVIDFKELSDTSIEPYLLFLSELKGRLSKEGRKTLVTLPAYEDRFDYWQLSEAVDHVILLAYDQHWDGGDAGPLSAQGWFESFLDRVFEANTGTKFIIAIGSYAVDWAENGGARSITVAEAWDLLDDSNSTHSFDEDSLNSTFGYQSSGKNKHRVWMLDGITTYNQVAAALAMKPGGLALWRLGTEDPTVWASFARQRVAEEAILSDLQQIEPTGGIVHKGEGEVLTVKDRQTVGRRELQFNRNFNLITSQTVLERPRSLSLHRWGHNKDKKLALTFDDGPSRAYTAQILDILREKDVKATFFVVGANASMEPTLLERIYNDGHDIGNHTFTHPNLRLVGPTLLDLELNATQRVLEAKLGIGTHLFRPPFNKDSEPVNKDEAAALLAAARLGYMTIGLKIDPLDWARPGADKIVERTVSYARAREGNIVLLHDGGGDRQQTVDALPAIIDQLRGEGFHFVTVHELLDMKRDEVMPSIKSGGAYEASVNNLGFTMLSTGSNMLSALFVISISLGIGRLFLVSVGAIAQQRRNKLRITNDWQPEKVAILVPAYNEEKVIAQSISSLIDSVDPSVEIIIIDDGSADRTADVAEATIVGRANARVIRKINGGKASALNTALQETDADVVVAIDADTRLEKGAVFWLTRHFSDPTVGAVAGTVDVGNSRNLITKFQELEYTISQNLDRRAFETVHAISVVPGAIGAWRREALLSVGGYGEDTLAEDADVTIKLQRAGWTVLTEPRAIAVTEAPATVRLFLRQRFRWMFGTLQVAWKNLDCIRYRGARGIKFLTLPNILLFQFFFALAAPVIDMLLIASLIADGHFYIQGQAAGLSGRTTTLVTYWAIWQLLELMVGLLAYKIDGRRPPLYLFPMLVLQRFCYRQLIYYVALKSLAAAIRGRLVGWDKLPRAGLQNPAQSKI